MRLRIRLSGYWRWLWLPISFVLGLFAAAIVQNVVDKTVQEAQINTSVWVPAASAAGWLLANWIAVTGWVLFITLGLAVLFTYLDDRKTRATRILEYYAIHLLFHRKFALGNQRTIEELQDIARWLNEVRGTLLNHTPRVFTQATTEAFRRPALLNLANARLEVQGMTHEDARASMIAHADHLLNAVTDKWLAYDGLKREEP